MILSASRRTDIPAFYGTWFLRRLRDGEVLVQNPMNAARLSRVSLRPDLIDCIVFWTKNPRPMLDGFAEVEAMGYPFYVQFTLTPYEKYLEPGVPDKAEVQETFRKLSGKIGRARVVWRYDPILLNEDWTASRHIRRFEEMAAELCGYAERCVFSFVDPYAKISRAFKQGRIRRPDSDEMRTIAQGIADAARRYGFKLSACAEAEDFAEFGVTRSACIDAALIERILGASLSVKKASGQRPECGCAESVDIGAYHCCGHRCLYCYANGSDQAAAARRLRHDPGSALLIGRPLDTQIITTREIKSLKAQPSLFDPFGGS